MKKFLFFLSFGLLLLSCEKKIVKISDSSLYNLPYQWETPTKNEIKLSELKGKVVTLVMIYTSCKTACPKLTQEMKAIESQVGNHNAKEVQYVLVSIDPENDTPEKMALFIKNNKLQGKQWLFLRGDEESTKELANVLAVKYKKISPMDFSHSNIISVFSKTGELAYQQEGLGLDIEGTVNEIKKQLKSNN